MTGRAKRKAKPSAPSTARSHRPPTDEERKRCILNVEQIMLECHALAEKSRPEDVVSEALLAAALFAMDKEISLERFMVLFGKAMTAALHEEVGVVVYRHEPDDAPECDT